MVTNVLAQSSPFVEYQYLGEKYSHRLQGRWKHYVGVQPKDCRRSNTQHRLARPSNHTSAPGHVNYRVFYSSTIQAVVHEIFGTSTTKYLRTGQGGFLKKLSYLWRHINISYAFLV